MLGREREGPYSKPGVERHGVGGAIKESGDSGRGGSGEGTKGREGDASGFGLSRSREGVKETRGEGVSLEETSAYRASEAT